MLSDQLGKSIHPATSQSWGDDACARLCMIIVDSNHAFVQQVMEDRTDMLDLCTLEELSEPDDIGLTLPFFAVYFDKPRIMSYLFKRGLDLSKPCDPMKFGNPMFYAISLHKPNVVIILDYCDCSVKVACDRFNQTAMDHAERLHDEEMKTLIHKLATKEIRAAILFQKHFIRRITRRLFLKKKSGVSKIQGVIRGVLCRRNLGIIKKIDMTSLNDNNGNDSRLRSGSNDSSDSSTN
eukprot:gene4613-9164_t